tara:strand:- start:8042 stop:9604 length:1563 start_codon:yes stop_codon:yes gene_type:complete
MCGFLVYFKNVNSNQEYITYEKFKKESLNIAHRGPDSNSTINYQNKAFFCHYRLSIIDRSPSSNQPFFSICKRYILCFNGEIYNYKLLAKKYFPTESIKGDTELLMKLLINYPADDFIHEIEGMFSCVFFDTLKNSYIALRDRFGIKPLYYSLDEKYAFFCSESYPISKLINSKIDEVSINELKSFRRPTPGYSFFDNVYECLPGKLIEKNKIRNWSRSSPEVLSDNFSHDELFDRINYVFNLNTIGDVPHCSFQSGGIDSSLISLLTKPDIVYSIGMESDNELEASRKVAKKLGIKIFDFEVNVEDFNFLLKSYLEIKKEPVSVPNEILIFKLCKEMNLSNKFFLSGEGADEMFFGYDKIFRWSREKGNIKDNDQFLDEFISKYCYSEKAFKSERFIKFCYQLFTKGENRTDFIEDFFLDFHLPGLLARADRASMAAGIEARVPFCSQTICNYMYRRPYEIKIKGKFSKLPLRKILEKSALDFVLKTPKIGFRTLMPGLNQKETYNYMLKYYFDIKNSL